MAYLAIKYGFLALTFPIWVIPWAISKSHRRTVVVKVKRRW